MKNLGGINKLAKWSWRFAVERGALWNEVSLAGWALGGEDEE